jgi:hypothetical protein
MTTATFSWIGSSIGFAVGGPIGASIGSWIGSSVGAYVDNMIIQSLLAPDPPRLDDLSVQVSTYGRAIPELFGDEVRSAGNVIWSTGLIETRQGGKGAPPNEAYTYSTSVAVLLGKGVLNGISKILANGQVIYDEANPETPLPPRDPVNGYVVQKSSKCMALFETMRFYPGSSAQPIDPEMEAHLGVGNVPRYKGCAYVVISGLQLADYGNRLPNLEFLIQPVPGEQVGEACQRIVALTGINPAMVGSGAITQPLNGYVIANMANASGALQPLALAFDFDLAEVWGSLRLQPRGTSIAGIIPLEDLGAVEFGNTPDERLRWPRIAQTQMPRMSGVTFQDPERDFQVNTQRASRSTGSAEANVSFTVPVVMSADYAAQLADKLLWEAWTSRAEADTSVGPRWNGLEPARTYILEGRDTRERVKVIRNTRGWNGVGRLFLRKDRPVVYRSTRTGVPAAVPPNELQLPGDTTLQLLDIPILLEQNDDSGFYWAAAGESDGWRGMDLFRSLDDTDFTRVASEGVSTIMGEVAVAIDDGPSHIWDLTTVITVTLDNAERELVSVTQEQVLAGANLAWVGDEAGADGELLQFATADLVAPGVYELSTLLRGRFGTEYATGAHGAAERFVLITLAGVNRADFGAGDWNKDRFYRPVSVLQDITEVPSTEFANTGEGKRPYSPVHLEGTRDGSDNLTLEWVRRSRIPAPGLGNGNVPLGESAELYEVDILDGVDVVRTISTSTPLASYTAAEQTADGLTPGDPVSGVVYQISDSRGRGRPAEFTV